MHDLTPDSIAGTAVICNHTSRPRMNDGGPVWLLAQFLMRDVDSLIMLEHPFEGSSGEPSVCTYYTFGNVTRTNKSARILAPVPVVFVKDVVYTCFKILTLKREVHAFFGFDSLNALSGLFLRLMGRVKRVAFYSIDYSPTRFSSGPLNWIYRSIEILVSRRSDYTWCISDRIRDIRIKQGTQPSRCLVVPSPVNLDEYQFEPRDLPWRRKIAFVGNLASEKGVDLVIQSMSALAKLEPDLRLIIIGDGPARHDLEKLVVSLGLEQTVQFTGYVSDFREVLRKLDSCDVGVACYPPSAKYNPYAFPLKVLVYLACGLPVITTRAESFSREVILGGAGLVIDFDEEDFVKAIRRLYADQEFYALCSKNARKLSRNYHFGEIFRDPVRKMLQT